MLSGRKLSDKEWIRNKPGKFKYAGYALARTFYRSVPSAFAAEFTVGGAFIAACQVALILAITFIPVAVSAVLATPTPPNAPFWANPWFQAKVIFLLQVAKLILDKLKAYRTVSKERLRDLSNLSVSLSAALGVIERQIEQFSKTPEAAAQLDAFLQHALKCIEATVKLCADKLDDRYCCVSLLTFEANGMVKIRARSTVERRTGALVAQDKTFAYLAARYAIDSFSVHHFRWTSWFRKCEVVEYRGLSAPGKPPYRSILVLPLPAVIIPGQNQVRKGAVTIDAAGPFEFLGKELTILVRVQAYLHLVNLMLTNHGIGIEPEI